MPTFTMSDEARAWLDSMNLAKGAHNPNGQACAMEAVARISGQTWSDSPENACPVIGAFMRNWNDNLPDDEARNRLLKPILPIIVGTKSTPAVELRRSYMALDWFIREHVPAWFDLTLSLKPSGDALRAADEIVSAATLAAIKPMLDDAQTKAAAAGAAAWAAAWAAARASAADAAGAAARAAAGAAAGAAARAAAGDAAGAAAGDAAGAAARAAKGDAAGAAARASAADAAGAAAGDAAGAAAGAAAGDAAWAAARDAARAAAWAAAWAAARAAAWAALKPTTKRLQLSAIELVKRMCEVTE